MVLTMYTLHVYAPTILKGCEPLPTLILSPSSCQQVIANAILILQEFSTRPHTHTTCIICTSSPLLICLEQAGRSNRLEEGNVFPGCILEFTSPHTWLHLFYNYTCFVLAFYVMYMCIHVCDPPRQNQPYCAGPQSEISAPKVADGDHYRFSLFGIDW